MNFLVVLGLLGIVVLLKLQKLKRMGLLYWVVCTYIGSYIFLRWGFAAPLPVSIIKDYMMIVTMALLVYVSSDKKRWGEVWEPTVHFVTSGETSTKLYDVMIFFPVIVMAVLYISFQSETVSAPNFGRSVHPAPPSSIIFNGKTIDLVKGDNPLRKLEKENPEEFKKHLSSGKKVYYQNCFYCHGDAMAGKGIFRYGLNPIPTDFVDPANIGMLTEGFLFWRVAKGGIGLPDESAPWDSAMPAWENFLTEEEIWEVIAYLYEYTGNRPRAVEHHE